MELTEQTSKITALAIGGPLHGKRLRSLPPTAVTVPPTVREPAEGMNENEIRHVYTLFRYGRGGWRIGLPVWVHSSQVVEGSPMIDQHDLPESWRSTTYARCPLHQRWVLG